MPSSAILRAAARSPQYKEAGDGHLRPAGPAVLRVVALEQALAHGCSLGPALLQHEDGETPVLDLRHLGPGPSAAARSNARMASSWRPRRELERTEVLVARGAVRVLAHVAGERLACPIGLLRRQIDSARLRKVPGKLMPRRRSSSRCTSASG